MTPSAPTVSCPACGASLPVDPALDHVVCAYCRARADVPPAVRERARAHAQELARLSGALADARESAAKQRWDVTVQRSSGWILGAGFAGTTVFAVVLGLAGVTNQYALMTSAVPVLLAMGWTFVGGALRRRVRDGALGGEAVAACATCGGPVRYRVGATSVVCPSCRATTVLSAALGGALAQKAEAQVRAAEGDAVRATYARLLAELEKSSESVGGAYGTRRALVVVAISALVVLAGVLIAASANAPGDVQSGAVFVAGGLVGAALGVIGAVWTRALDRGPRRVREVMSRAARAAAGRFTEGDARTALGWLATHWPSRAPALPALERPELREAQWLTLELAPAGAPALVAVAFQPSKRRSWINEVPLFEHLVEHEPSLAFVLVGWPTGRPDAPAAAHPALARAVAAGVRAHAGPAGVYLEPPSAKRAYELVDDAVLDTVQAARAVAASA